MTVSDTGTTNRAQRRALERRARHQPAQSAPLTAEQAQAHVQGFIYQRAKETLEVVSTLLELVDDEAIETELMEAESILRRTVVAAGMALLRPAVEAIANAQDHAEKSLKPHTGETDTPTDGIPSEPQV